MIRILKSELNNIPKFKRKLSSYIQDQIKHIQENHNISFNEEELSELLLSACRSNDLKVISFKGNKMFLDEEKTSKWIYEKLLPNTVILKLDDQDILRLLIFCIEITYQMFLGGTKATITAKGFRERRRTFESILVDQFIGKLGEIMLKKFLEKNFTKVRIELDWEISNQLQKHKNDIKNAKKKVSIKSSPALSGIWAEAEKGYDYGIMVKCSVPQQPILQFFIEVCGFSRLIDFAEGKIPADDLLFKNYLKNIKKRIYDFKCGEIKTELKGFICGYFKTSKDKLKNVNETLPYLGKIREERYLVRIDKLKYKKEQWEEFLYKIGLLHL